MEPYRVVLESQVGPREGTLRLEEQNGALTGTITLLGVENPVFGQWTGNRSFQISHHLRTKLSDLTCVSVFELDENGGLTGTLRNGQNVMKWHGEKETGKKGGNGKHGGE